MKKNILIGTLIVILTVGFVNPPSANAGDKEWATAGKVLTGIVAANVIGDLFASGRDVEVRSAGYSQKSYYKCRPKKRIYRNYGYSGSVNWKSPRKYRRGGRSKTRYRRVIKCAGPIIVHIEKGRRIYQPRERGAIAYLQVYSKVCDEWVNVEEYPSIW